MTGEKVQLQGVRGMLERVFAAVAVLVGLGMAVPGVYLLTLGGSPYYILAGTALVAAGVNLWRGRPWGASLFLLVWLATVVWALWESGLNGWALLPRLGLLTGMLLVLGLIRWRPGRRPARVAATTAVAMALVAGVSLALIGSRTDAAQTLADASSATASPAAAPGAVPDGEWHHVGRTTGADRFSPLDQITPANVAKLKVAWTARLGMPAPGAFGALEATPLMIGDTLYLCKMDNAIVAVDADNGRIKWSFDPKVDPAGVGQTVCRGVTYHRQPDVTGPCAERVFVATVDGRMFAVDAANGRPCQDFGAGGQVDLREGMGDVPRGYYTPTSPPVLVRNRLVIGGRVADSQTTDNPSGVIRAFDPVSGKLVWAWDMGRPDRQGLPPPGETYTRSTPNAWVMIAGDEKLGLVYAPLGNPTPDWVTGHRTPVMNKYSSALVAIDVETGKERWHYQTTHLDIWDYDLASTPSLVDFPTANGLRPAVVQATKRGQFFVLDRETGEPLVKTVERPVPQSPAPGEKVSPTQPYSVGMPSMGSPRLTEASMWGITPFDQIWCRIRFKQARYDGEFTPVGIKPTILSPGYLGGSNWGGISIDPERRIMVANVMQLPLYSQLIPRAEADPAIFQPGVAGKHEMSSENWPQIGTPYAIKTLRFLSPTGVPCTQPPFSEIAAIDLNSRKFLWRQPLGTAQDSGPWGIASRLALTIGVPFTGGSMVTRSGLVFIGATQERALRAIDLKTGAELWKDRLPAGAHANPMSYRSARTGRQYIVVPASGYTSFANGNADLLIAYALPE